MSVRRSKSDSAPRRARRSRPVVGAGGRREPSLPVRVVAPTPRPPTLRTPAPRAPESPATQVRPRQRRATFDIAAPRVMLNPWPRAHDWRASRPKFAAAVMVVLLLGALYALFNLDVFYVNDAQVVGNKLVPKAEVQQVAGMRGWNIFFVEPGAVAAAVKTLPEFKDVQVYVTLPNTVEIYTTERKPVFVWEVGGKNYWVDDQGIAMRPRGLVPNGWHVRDAEGQPGQYGARVNSDAFNAAVSLINVWKDAPRYFEWTKEHGLTLRDGHGWLIYFGGASQMSDKLIALNIVTNQLLHDKRSVVFIDLGSGLPYYQEAAPPPATTTKQP